MKLLTTIVAALALLLLPAAAQARGDHHGRKGARAQSKTGKGVVRSFRGGVLTIRLTGGRAKSATVTGDTEFSCRGARKRKRRAKAQRRRARGGRLARAAREDADDPDEGGIDVDVDEPAGDDQDEDEGGADDFDEPGDDVEEDEDEVEDPDEGTGRPGRRRSKRRVCSARALRRGVRVKAAKVASGADGPVWTKLVLQRR